MVGPKSLVTELDIQDRLETSCTQSAVPWHPYSLFEERLTVAAQFFSLMIDFHVFAFVIESRLHSQQSSRPASGERKRYSRYILLLQYHAYKRQTVWFTTREVASNQISGGPVR